MQEKVRSGEVEIVKVGTHENIADTLTKHVNNQNIVKHMKGMFGVQKSVVGHCLKHVFEKIEAKWNPL